MNEEQILNTEPDDEVYSRDVSCRVTNSLLKYLESEGYDTGVITEGLPYSEEYLSDPLNWVPYSVRETMVQRAAALTGDHAIMFKVGLNTPKLRSLSGVEQLVLRLGGPKMAYRSIPRYAGMFDNTSRFQVTIKGDNTALVCMSLSQGYQTFQSACQYTQGILAAIPTLWGVAPAEVFEKKCMCQLSNVHPIPGVEYGLQSCLFEVTWQTPPSRHSNIGKKLFDRFQKRSTEELEDNFRLLDAKNLELRTRNIQLAKVRELALAIDSVRTQNEVFKTVVELARDMPGVRFIIMLKKDESGEYVTAPYYSKVRSKTISTALKAAGFDTDIAFGNKPDSQIFRFPASVSKTQKDFDANPRVMVKSSIADLLDGIWPRVLCDSIQKIAGINNITIIPIFIDKQVWGNLLFFLFEEVPGEILEMVGAHCAAALKNVSRIDTLERRNKELEVLNRIEQETMSSLDLSDMLNKVIKETAEIFSAKSGAIYLLDARGSVLELRATFGMHDTISKQNHFLSLENTLSGAFLASNKDVISGDLREYSNEYPLFASQSPETTAIPFAMAALKKKNTSYGLLNIVRSGKEPFAADELILLQSIANQLSVSIENAQLHGDVLLKMEETEQANARLERAVHDQAESERKYRLIAENTADYISILTLKGIYTYLSPSHLKLGYVPAEFLGKFGLDFIHPEDKKRLLPMLAKYAAMRAKQLLGLKSENFSETIEFRVRDAGGEWHYLEAKGSLIDSPHGKRPDILLISRDVTERRKSEIALKEQRELVDATLSSTTNAVLIMNKQNQVLLVNDAFCSIFSMKKEDAVGRPIDRVVPAPRLCQAISEVLSKNKPHTDVEFRFSIGTSERIFDAKITPMRKGEALLIISDITEERERQQTFYQTDRLASVGEMASGIAHELNNPLTSIAMLSKMLVKDGMPEEDKEDLIVINNEAKRAAAIVRNLLTFARKHPSVRQAAQINTLLEDILKLRSYEHKVNNIRVDTRFDRKLPEIQVDYFQLQQVFLNLILNAEQSMVACHNQGTLTITTEKGTKTIKVSVSDDGEGISKENMEKLFTPFFTTKEVGKGTGLGLSISYGIVTNHGGKIYAQSVSGKGAKFVVELPLNAQ